MIQKELFDPEPPGCSSEKMEFSFTLKDGSPVSARFERRFLPFTSHIDFYGPISETGYQSLFMDCLISEPDDAVIEKAKEIAGALREETIRKIDKKNRRVGRRRSEQCLTN